MKLSDMQAPFIKRLIVLFTIFTMCFLSAFAQQHLTLNNFNNQNEIKAGQSITLTDGFHIPSGKTVRIYTSVNFQNCVDLISVPSSNLNYQRTRIFKVPGVNAENLNNTRSVCDENQQISYLDGLGRPLQNVYVKATPDVRDLVQPVAFDEFGKQSKAYLPYAIIGSGQSDGSYRSSALLPGQGVFDFYNPAGSTGLQQSNGVVRTTHPYAKTGFEASSLNRIIEQGSPGEAWQFSGTGNSNSSTHTLKQEYGTNDQSGFNSSLLINNPGSRKVALYTAIINNNQSRTLNRSNQTATYGNGQLHLTIKKSENWQPGDGCIGTTEEYKNQQGQIVLNRTYNLKANQVEMISTYYVYDDFGNLSFVLPEGVSPEVPVTISASLMDAFGFQYRYDERNRVSQKKLPGKGWEYMVYNKLDKVVAIQDSVQRMKSVQEWTIIKYDGLGRMILTGTYLHSGSTPGMDNRSIVQGLVNAELGHWETVTGAGNGYTATTWPTSWTSTLALNYYDDYASIPGLPAVYNKQTEFSNLTTGFLTASKIAVMDSADMLWSVYYYDDEGNVAKTFKQHYLGGSTSLSPYHFNESTLSYSFVHQLTGAKFEHFVKNSGGTGAELKLTASNDYNYDHAGRLLSISQQIQNGTSPAQAGVLILKNEYNEIGQLKLKNLHSINNGTDFLQHIDYRYNAKGQLSNINNSDLVSDGGFTNTDQKDQFGMELSYENTSTTKPMYNGMVSTARWKSGAIPGVSQVKYGFDYAYDPLNRLTSSVSSRDGIKNQYYNEHLSYNTMNNIVALGRYDQVSGIRTMLDTLTFTYQGGQHVRVDDASSYNGDSGFQDAAQVNGEYGYDGNGNMVKDLNKGISNIAYNGLNLPGSIVKSGGDITYAYDASGKVLRKIFNFGSGAVVTDYIDGIQYTNGIIEFIQTGEGRARKSGSLFTYEYDLKDHLGNTRVTIKPDPVNSAETTPLVLQENSYYAFGGLIVSLEPIVTSPKNNYLYNGKELQPESGLYNYGARFYDPLIGKWNGIDPLAEQYVNISPYGYVVNNPVNFTDPDGRKVEMNSGGQWSKSMDSWTAKKSEYTTKINETTEMLKRNGADEKNLASALAPLYEKLGEALAVIDQLNQLVTSPDTWGYRGGTWVIVAAGDNNNDLENAGIAFGMIGLAGDLGANSTASFRLTNGAYNGSAFSPQIYNSGWGGGSMAKITTYRMSNLSKGISFGAGAVGTGLSYYQIASGKAQPITYVDAGVGTVGVMSSLAGYYSGAQIPYVGEAVMAYGTLRLLWDVSSILGASYGPSRWFGKDDTKYFK